MKKSFEVIWTHTAENDLLGIIEYIAQNSIGNALNILENIKKQVSELYFSPKRCRIVPELANQGINQYRDMVIPPWRVIYKISESTVYVLSVLDSRQNVEDILLKRLTPLMH